MPYLESVEVVREFLARGGDVLVAIGAVTFCMWVLIFERAWYFWKLAPVEAKRVQAIWDARNERTSWSAHQERTLLISEVRIGLSRSLLLISTLVALCPLFGLLV